MNVHVLNHASSQLLYEEENKRLHRLIGSKSECLAMAVIQLFYTRPPTHAQWFKESAGVLCFIKDNVRKEFIFKMYNMDSEYYTVVFEEDLQAFMDYKEDNNFFHTIQCENNIKGFNFANNYEASTMNIKIQERLQWLQHRLQNQMIPRPYLTTPTTRENLDSHFRTQNSHTTYSGFIQTALHKPSKKNGGKKQKINKDDIGMPTNFVHTLHYGINMDKNFSLEDCPAELRDVLKTANITNTQLQDPNIREVIRTTIDFHQNQNNYIDIQKEIDREETYMVRHKSQKIFSTKESSTPQLALPSRTQCKPIDLQNEIQREENYIVRYKFQQNVSPKQPRRSGFNFQQHEYDRSHELLVPQVMSGIRRLSSSHDGGLQIAVDQNELFSAINSRRSSKEISDWETSTRKPPLKLPQRQPTLKSQNRPLVLPQRKDSQLTIPRPKMNEASAMVGRPLPSIPVVAKKVNRNPSHLHGSKHEPPKPTPPPTPNKSSSKGLSGPGTPSQPSPMLSPPPPPPPPPPSFPSDNLFNNDTENTDGRSALFDAIKKGASLKPPDASQSKSPSIDSGTSRNDLLSEIRMGKQLIPVQARNLNSKLSEVEDLSSRSNDLAAALTRALKIRNVAIQSEDDSNDEMEESDDDWDT